MELTTERLIVRSFQPDDAPAYAEIVQDPEVMRYLGDTLDFAAARNYVIDCVHRDRNSGVSRYAVLTKTDMGFIGFCGFKFLDEDQGGQIPPGRTWVDFGWRYRRSVWRKGYGFEAAKAVYDYGKSKLCLNNIEARAHEDNTGSLRIIEKLGFRWLNDYASPVGTFRRYREVD